MERKEEAKKEPKKWSEEARVCGDTAQRRFLEAWNSQWLTVEGQVRCKRKISGRFIYFKKYIYVNNPQSL